MPICTYTITTDLSGFKTVSRDAEVTPNGVARQVADDVHFPNGMAITPDGKQAFMANRGDNTVSVITTATGAVSAPITVGKGPVAVAITPDGKRAYVTDYVGGKNGSKGIPPAAATWTRWEQSSDGQGKCGHDDCVH